MSLLSTETKSTATFEADEDGVITTTPENVVTTATQVTTENPTTAAPIAPVQPRALAVTGMVNPMDAIKNALPVDYNTLEQVIPSQGNFMCRESGKVLGDTIDFEVLSHQDSFVVSPEDDKAPKEVVRYSSDGLTCSDGTSVAEHLHWLRTNGYPRARTKARIVVVVALIKTVKNKDEEGSLVQLDLSPANRTQWTRYMVNAARKVQIGMNTAQQVLKVTATAEIATSGSNIYTLAKFAVMV